MEWRFRYVPCNGSHGRSASFLQNQVPVPIPTALSRFAMTLGMCVFVTLPVSACQDVESDPLAVAVAPETHGALLLGADLSSVPHLLTEQGLALEGAAEAEAWWESWTLSRGEGARLRSRIYPSAARRLYPALAKDGVRHIISRHEETLKTLETVGDILTAEVLSEAMVKARTLHADALAALNAGDGENALGLALQSVDALWEVSPRQVALELLEQATEALGRNPTPSSYSDEELTRIRRLTSGAREALEEGDYPRAIRRAYYACQLLGVELP